MFTIVFSVLFFVVLIYVFSQIFSAMRQKAGDSPQLTDQVSHGFIFVIQQQHCGVIERLGKFHHIVGPGLHICIPIIDKVRDVSLMTEDNNMTFDAKTKDNVTIELDVSIQYCVDSRNTGDDFNSGIYRSLYTLSNPVSQMRDYFADALRSQIPKRSLDEVFEEKDTIANAIEEDVANKMIDYGYQIITTLITSIKLPNDVQVSMNRIVATKNDLQSAKNEAEADKTRQVVAAQAEAESMKLQGQGIADQRIAIAEGLASSLDVIKQSGLNSDEANSLLMFTQNIQMMEEFARSGRSSTVVLPNEMSSANNFLGQLLVGSKSLNPSAPLPDDIVHNLPDDIVRNLPNTSSSNMSKSEYHKSSFRYDDSTKTLH